MERQGDIASFLVFNVPMLYFLLNSRGVLPQNLHTNAFSQRISGLFRLVAHLDSLCSSQRSGEKGVNIGITRHA
jgi:hypothetical protein